MTKKALFATLVAAPLLALMMASITVWIMYQSKYTGPEVAFTVMPGDTFGQVNARLYKNNVISNPRLFHWLARFDGSMEKLRAGSFPIPSGSRMADVLDILVNGQPMLVSITLPEGRNMYEIAALMERATLTTKEDFLTYVRNSEVVKSFGIDAPSLEGYLYPETYKFAPGTATKDLVNAMVNLFKQKVGTLNQGHPFLSPHEVVVLASVVEKETGAKVERPQIASVFTNRLKKRMRLESDPTTIYGIWENYAGNLRKIDLQTYSPYNTYKIPALPLGPIANPSLDAIKAVMNPDKTDYFFFVSKNDGTHVFTKTYAEHLKAVNEWQKNRANREGKSWRQLKQ